MLLRSDRIEMDTTTLSIIVPVFQRRDTASQFFQSLRETLTSPSKTQIIIVDDGSPSETSVLLHKESRLLREHGATVELVSHETNMGCASSLNDGFHRADGKAIILADSDLILRPGWDNSLIESLNPHSLSESKLAGMAASALLYPQSGGVQHAGVRFGSFWLRHWLLNAEATCLPEGRQSVQLAPFALFAMTREVYDTIGGIDTSYRNGYEDFDFQMRARAEGFRTSLVTSHPSYHWEMRSGPARNENRKANLGRFISKWGSTLEDDATDRIVEELKTGVSRGKAIIDVTRMTATSGDVLERLLDQVGNVDLRRPSRLESLPLKDSDAAGGRIYFVDNFVELLDYYYWLKQSATSLTDWVVDQYGNSMPLKGIISRSWPGRKIR